MKRKRYTPEFKTQVVLEVLKEEKTMSQIASERGVHVNQLHNWKKQFLQEMPQIFDSRSKDWDRMKADYEEKLESPYAEVGKLTTQLSWVKKIWHLPRLDRNAWKWWTGRPPTIFWNYYLFSPASKKRPLFRRHKKLLG